MATSCRRANEPEVLGAAKLIQEGISGQEPVALRAASVLDRSAHHVQHCRQVQRGDLAGRMLGGDLCRKTALADSQQ
jgi:hypothetical protein